MKVLGTLLIGFAAFIALAAIFALAGPGLHARGIPVSGVVYPWALWLVVAVFSLATGLLLRRRSARSRE